MCETIKGNSNVLEQVIAVNQPDNGRTVFDQSLENFACYDCSNHCNTKRQNCQGQSAELIWLRRIEVVKVVHLAEQSHQDEEYCGLDDYKQEKSVHSD